MLQEVHSDNCSVIQYNNENSLACVLSLDTIPHKTAMRFIGNCRAERALQIWYLYREPETIARQ